MTGVSTRNTSRIILFLLLSFAFLYLGQGLIYWLRLNQMGAVKLKLQPVGEVCDELRCTAEWSFVASERFVLLGHILRTHELEDTRTGENVVPVSRVRGTMSDSWATLRVYPVELGAHYILRATKYKAIKMGYFIGLLPRTASHQGILSIPDVGPTVSMISGLALVFLLSLLFGAAVLGGASASVRSHRNKVLKYYAFAASFWALSAFVSMGILDTILPEGDLRNKVLRISLILGLAIPVVTRSQWVLSGKSWPKVAASSLLISFLCLIAWPWIRGGAPWAIVLCALTAAGVATFYSLGFKLVAIVWGLALIDSLKIFGLIELFDYPPIYFANVVVFVSLAHVFGEMGGYATISLAGVAYRRFKRDLVLRVIQETIESSDATDSSARVVELQRILPEVSTLTGAQRVTVTISLPLGRPVTQYYDARDGDVRVFDDGKIPGAVTLRCLVYGDQAMYESFDEFAKRVMVPHNPDLADSGYFCALPLRVNQTIVGAIMLTGFDDDSIVSRRDGAVGGGLSEERDTIQLLAERLSQSLSKLIVNDMDATAKLSRQLQASIHQAIAASESDDDFLQRFVGSLHSVSGLGVMIHERFDDRGVAVAQLGIRDDVWETFCKYPFNLSKVAKPAYGPSVVAFRDGRSSYVKDIMELTDKMHPRTVDLMESMSVMSVLAVPFNTLQRSFVVSLLSRREQGPADPALLSVLEAAEALFVAAVEVMSQKTSVLALGRLASRLIGDEEVRGKILNAAREESLPTTIGSAKASFLLLFDLVGSSKFLGDAEEKARAYGQFYDAVNRKCQEALGGVLRKTIGDAVIVTWDGTGVSISDRDRFLSDLREVVIFSDEVAQSIGCRGARAVLHFGSYFLGLVGTQTFGQIDVIGNAIDEVCKIEGRMKTHIAESRPILLAVSSIAADNLSRNVLARAHEAGFIQCESDANDRLSVQYLCLRSVSKVDHVA